MSWAANKATILSKVASNSASPAEQAWYDTYIQAGSPATQAELQAWKAQNTGVSPGEPVTYWNPEADLFQTDPFNPDANYKPGDDYGYYLNPNGQYVYGLQPENTHQYYDGDGYTTVQGADPRPSNPPPSQPGMAQDGGQYYGDPNDPNNTGNLVDQPGYQPPIEYDPFNPNVPPPGGGTPPPTDGGGGGWDWLADNPLEGWEASTNKDFYQQQFKDLRDREDNEQTRALAAAIRGQTDNSSQLQSDPWSAFGGSEQFKPVIGASGTGERTLRPEFEGLSNQQIVAQSGLDDPWYNQLFAENEGLGAQTNWGTAGYDRLTGNTAAGGLNPKNKARMQTVYDTIYTGTPLTPGGFNVPAGYASPVNA